MSKKKLDEDQQEALRVLRAWLDRFFDKNVDEDRATAIYRRMARIPLLDGETSQHVWESGNGV